MTQRTNRASKDSRYLEIKCNNKGDRQEASQLCLGDKGSGEARGRYIPSFLQFPAFSRQLARFCETAASQKIPDTIPHFARARRVSEPRESPSLVTENGW